MEVNRPYPSVGRVMEMTAFKDEATALAAIATLKWLDQGAPHKIEGYSGKFDFDMTNYIIGDTRDDIGCGTACCIAGAIELHKKTGSVNGYISRGFKQLGNDFDFNPEDNKHELTQLFFPRDNGTVIVYKSAEQAAETLRNYLFSGKVEWK